MVKAKDFWNYLCEGLDYRIFAGNACAGLEPLYENMNPEIMHYIPTVRENVAIGIISGSYIGGFKGGIFMRLSNFMDIVTWLRTFCVDLKIPFLIFLYVDTNDLVTKKYLDILSLPKVNLNKNYKASLNKISKLSEEKGVPGIVFIKEGTLE
jgi:sulfopyruvate decarboxylase TPP-binding subunit